MKLFTSKAFRARFAECARAAEKETIYIERPEGRLAQLIIVPDEDARLILKSLGNEKERNLKK